MITYVELNRIHSALGAFGGTITGATNASPVVITCAAATNLISGDQVQVTGVSGNTNANSLAYALVLSNTTFSMWSDAAMSASPIAGNGAYTSGGQVSIAKDVSQLAGDFTLRLAINAQTVSRNAVLAIQDSADGFVNDIRTLWAINTQGGQGGGFYAPPNSYDIRSYQVPSLRMGVSNARLRLFVMELDSMGSGTMATVTTTLLIEQ